MTDYPALDAPRLIRYIFDDTLTPLEPFVEEIDGFFTLPVRVVYNERAGVHLELGPYSLGKDDIDRLRAAIAAYDRFRSDPSD